MSKQEQPQYDLNENFYIFDNFIISNKHILERGDDDWDSSKIFFQLSIEHADNSPLTYGAESFEEDGKVDWDYIRDINRSKEMYINPLVATLEGSEDGITDFFTLNNDYLLSCDKNGIIIVWHTNNFDIVNRLDMHNNNQINGIKLGDDFFISFDYGGVANIWSIDDFSHITKIEHDDSINDIVILSNGNIVTVSDDQSIKIWNNETFDETFSYSKYDSVVIGCIERENNIITYTNSAQIVIFDKISYAVIEEYKYDNSLLNHEKSLYNIILTANGNYLLDIDYSKIKFLKQSDFQEIDSFDSIYSIKTLKNKKIALSSYKEVLIYNKKFTKIKFKIESNISSPKIFELSNNKIILYSNNSNIFEFYDTQEQSYEYIWHFKAHDEGISSIVELKNGSIITFSDDKKTAKIWKENDFNLFELLGVLDLTLEADRLIETQVGNIITYYEYENNALVWSLDNLKYSMANNDKYMIEKCIKLSSGDLLFLPNQRSRSEFCLKIFDKDILKVSHTLKGHTYKVYGAIELRNENIVSYSVDNNLILWDKKLDYTPNILDGHTAMIRSVIEIDSNKLISISDDDTIRLWNLNNLTCIAVCEEKNSITSVKRLKKTDHIIYIVKDVVKVVDTNLKQKYILDEHNDTIDNVVELESGNIVTFDNGYILKVWSVDYKCTKTIETDYIVKDIIELNNGNFIIVHYSNEIYIYDKNFDLLKEFNTSHKKYVEETIVQEGKLITTDYKTINIWNLENDELIFEIDYDEMVEFYDLFKNFSFIYNKNNHLLNMKSNDIVEYINTLNEKNTKWFPRSSLKILNVFYNNIIVSDNDFVKILKLVRNEK